MQVEEARICQTAGWLRNCALTFTRQAAASDRNLRMLSLCIIGLERGECIRMHSFAGPPGHMCATESLRVSEHH